MVITAKTFFSTDPRKGVKFLFSVTTTWVVLEEDEETATSWKLFQTKNPPCQIASTTMSLSLSLTISLTISFFPFHYFFNSLSLSLSFSHCVSLPLSFFLFFSLFPSFSFSSLRVLLSFSLFHYLFISLCLSLVLPISLSFSISLSLSHTLLLSFSLEHTYQSLTPSLTVLLSRLGITTHWG